ncbi:aldose 1-epimerase [Massilia cavernae]|uniref:Aldose 1-epimerase n=1 Tax=Massilia cavernae TaxID=2320864 RepID=A0A418XDX7_9BURK|nr:aldose 1-epimerase [Massilia cavernae]RJG10742.1 aldose 1-epimerase [Massilia cavernae]
MQVISLRNARLHAEVLPSAAGGLARLDWIADGPAQPVLRALDIAPGAAPPTTSQLACFPLVPWSNRIGGGGFTFAGRHVALSPNRRGEPCPIHGDGWQHPWTVQAQSPTGVSLCLDRRGGTPFSYHAQLRYVLVEAGLRVSLQVTNAGNTALPFGLGLHPWFERSAGVTLRARARRAWSRGSGGLPLDEIALPVDWDFSAARGLPQDGVDNAFSGWDGKAEIEWPETSIRLGIRADMGYYILYAPPGANFFCFEPVDHAINAHNLVGGAAGNGLTVLAPGQSLQRQVTFNVSRAERQGGFPA